MFTIFASLSDCNDIFVLLKRIYNNNDWHNTNLTISQFHYHNHAFLQCQSIGAKGTCSQTATLPHTDCKFPNGHHWVPTVLTGSWKGSTHWYCWKNNYWSSGHNVIDTWPFNCATTAICCSCKLLWSMENVCCNQIPYL